VQSVGVGGRDDGDQDAQASEPAELVGEVRAFTATREPSVGSEFQRCKTPGVAVRRFRPAARVALFLVAQGRCAICGEPLRPGWHADHARPVRAGGETVPANGQALCARCNLAKGARPA
jgi:5-methylcytosine-specific restriction endonuclease McrA